MWELLKPASYASATSSRAASRIRVDAQRALRQLAGEQRRSRAASTVGQLGQPKAIALIGLADDLGVRLNHGRPGAAAGPKAIRQAMCTYGVVDPEGFAWPTIIDVGDIIPAEGSGEAALHATHDRVRRVVMEVMTAGCFPIGLGGGHDLTLPCVSAVARFARERVPSMKIGGVYIDPHLDVRPTVGSGMPFRRLMEEDGIGPLVNIGWNRLANSADHVQYFRSGPAAVSAATGNRMLSLQEAQELMAQSQPTVRGAGRCSLFHTLHQPQGFFLSVDLDALDSSVMPAVSAINPSGLSMREIESIIAHVCLDDRLLACDLMELCPEHDAGGRGARVAAHVLWQMIAHLSHRFAASNERGI